MAVISTKIIRDPGHKDPRIAYLPDAIIEISSDFPRPVSIAEYVAQLGDGTCLQLLQKAYDLKAHTFHRLFVLGNMKRTNVDGEPESWAYVGSLEDLNKASAAFRPEKRERTVSTQKTSTADKLIKEANKKSPAEKAALVEKLRAAGLI